MFCFFLFAFFLHYCALFCVFCLVLRCFALLCCVLISCSKKDVLAGEIGRGEEGCVKFRAHAGRPGREGRGRYATTHKISRAGPLAPKKDL